MIFSVLPQRKGNLDKMWNSRFHHFLYVLFSHFSPPEKRFFQKSFYLRTYVLGKRWREWPWIGKSKQTSLRPVHTNPDIFWNSIVFIGLRSRPHEHRFKKVVSQCLKCILNNISHNFCTKEDGKTSFNYLDFWKEGFILFCISPSPSRLVDFCYYFFNVA